MHGSSGERAEVGGDHAFIDVAADADATDQDRTIQLMLMRWRGEREVSAWERAVVFALRSPHANSGDAVLSEADLAFLDFVADQAVSRFRTERER